MKNFKVKDKKGDEYLILSIGNQTEESFPIIIMAEIYLGKIKSISLDDLEQDYRFSGLCD